MDRNGARGRRCHCCEWRLPEGSLVEAWMGKQGGARVIYFTRLDAGELCMLLVYPKAEKDSIPGHILKQVRKELEHGNS